MQLCLQQLLIRCHTLGNGNVQHAAWHAGSVAIAAARAERTAADAAATGLQHRAIRATVWPRPTAADSSTLGSTFCGKNRRFKNGIKNRVSVGGQSAQRTQTLTIILFGGAVIINYDRVAVCIHAVNHDCSICAI